MSKKVLREHDFIGEKLCLCCSKPIPNQFSPFCNSCSVYNHRRQKDKEAQVQKLRKTVKKQQEMIIDFVSRLKNKEDKDDAKIKEDKLQSNDERGPDDSRIN